MDLIGLNQFNKIKAFFKPGHGWNFLNTKGKKINEWFIATKLEQMTGVKYGNNVCKELHDWIYLLNVQVCKECVAVLIELYKNNVSVSCVGSEYIMAYTQGKISPLQVTYIRLLTLDLIRGRY